jgi:hypothetical protein
MSIWTNLLFPVCSTKDVRGTLDLPAGVHLRKLTRGDVGALHQIPTHDDAADAVSVIDS